MDQTDSGRTVTYLKRTLSASNVNATNQIHEFIKVQQDACKDQLPTLKRDVTKSSMILPEQYNLQTLQLCVDLKCLQVLEREKCLNWCPDNRILLPLNVEADGNSLLHSLSLYMFGVHDRRLVLRQLLYQRLFLEQQKGPLRKRWMLKHDTRTGMTWNKVIEMASDKAQNGPVRYTQLTSIHVFTMANILARPIIVYCSNENKSGGTKDLFVGGIYLPLLRSTQECEKSPIVLGYDNGHFVPLISSETLNIPICKTAPSADALHCVPLVDALFHELHLNFLLPTEETGEKQTMIRNSYLDVTDISRQVGKQQKTIYAAMLKFKTPPAFSIELMWALEQFALSPNQNVVPTSNQMPASEMHAGKVNRPAAPLPPAPMNFRNDSDYTDMHNNNDDNIYESLILCSQNGCGNTVSSLNDRNLCAECYKIYLQERQGSIKKRAVPGKPDVVPMQATKMVNENSRPTNVAASSYDTITPRNSGVIASIPTSSYDKLHNAQNPHVNYNQFDNLPNLPNLPPPNLPDLSNLPNLPPPNLPNLSNLPNLPNFVDQEGYLCPQNSVKNQETDVNKSNVAAGYAGPKDSVRNKVLCGIPGCTNSIGEDGKHCNVHNPKTPRHISTCVMNGCSNSAEYNDNFLCMVCFQSRKGELMGNEGSFGVQSLANVLDPTPRPVQTSQQSCFPTPVRSNIMPPNMPQIPAIPPNIQDLPKIPDIPMIPPIPGTQFPRGPNFTPPTAYGGFEGANRNFGSQNATLNWQKGGAASNEGTKSLKCLHCDNHGNPSKEGLCNECWRQKEQGAEKYEVLLKCINEDCDGEASEKFNFLCEMCYKKQLEAINKQKKKDEGVPAAPQNAYQGANANRINQVNPGNFDTNNPINYGGAEQGNQMMHANYDRNTQMEHGQDHNQFYVNQQQIQQQMHAGNVNYELLQQQQRQQQQQQMQQMQQMQPRSINPILHQEQQQMHQGNAIYGMQHQTQIDPRRINQELQQQQMFRSDVIHPGGGQNTAQTGQHLAAVADVVKKKCKGLSCEFFGSEEYGGYCSGCFLNITKKETEKQAARTFAPADVAAPAPRVAPNQQVQTMNQAALAAPNTPALERCKEQYCQNYGSAQRMGYCSECFRRYGGT